MSSARLVPSLFIFLCLPSIGTLLASADDTNWAPYTIQASLAPDQIDESHFYLTMRDGVRIAVALYLPKELADGARIPAILSSTRYVRAFEGRWPFKRKVERPDTRACSFTANGYAYLMVDARGTGASFGRWPAPWAPDEWRDYGEVIDWIIEQKWSSGVVGTCGISYDGTTAEMTAATGNPALKAVAPEFSLFDSYADVAEPGGIRLKEFLREWERANAALDRNDVDAIIPSRLQRWAVKGIRPVDGPDGPALLEEALAHRNYNGNVFESLESMTYIDDLWPPAPELSAMDISPAGHIDTFESSGIPFYSYSGWFDGAYQGAAVKRYLTVKTPGSRLVIGPWSHGGRYDSSPSVAAPAKFNHIAELLRFFDYHLKGIDTGIENEQPVHYYTMGEEVWKATDKWPPAAATTPYYFGHGGALERTPTETEERDEYLVDYAATTGAKARWDSLLGGGIVVYGDRAPADEKLMLYETPPLESDIEVTGHGEVMLYVSSDNYDGWFITYLEDTAPDGHVSYVTEGELGALHRAVNEGTRPYEMIGPYHSFRREDAALLTPGKVETLHFALLPTSYLFKKDHRIRLAIAGADADHFGAPAFPPSHWQVHTGGEHASRVLLPIVD